MKKLDDYVKANKRLTVDSVIKINRPMGVIFSLLDIKIRLYSSFYLVPKPSKGSANSWKNQNSLKNKWKKSIASKKRLSQEV